MLGRLREIKKKIIGKFEILNAYKNDYREYSRWQYHNKNVKTQNSLEAKILRQTHVIEKGMSLSKPKEKFGVQKAIELLDFVDEFQNMGYRIEESEPVKNAIEVLAAYIRFHRNRGFEPADVISHFEKYRGFLSDKNEYGIEKISRKELDKLTHGEFPEFFCSRHSVRQFADRKIDIADIKKCVALAMRAPSACNRQDCKAYFYQDAETNNALGKLIAGNTGFENEVPAYLVITSDMSAFYDAFERNQIYVDGGIFSMALVEALHYYGIASCILQNGEFRERNLEFKKICGNIPENEKIILFIAIGYYKENVVYATSHRKRLDSVLIVK